MAPTANLIGNGNSLKHINGFFLAEVNKGQ